MHACRTCHTSCHFNSTMAETMFRFLIILASILCIVYQQVCPFGKFQKSRVVVFLPLDIGGIHNTPTGILDTVENRPIQGMAMRKLYRDAHLNVFCLLPIGDDYRFTIITMPPDNTLFLGHGMKDSL